MQRYASQGQLYVHSNARSQGRDQAVSGVFEGNIVIVFIVEPWISGSKVYTPFLPFQSFRFCSASTYILSFPRFLFSYLAMSFCF